MKDVERELDVENIYDLVDKEIKDKFETNYPTKQQIRKYKRHGSELIENEKFMYAHECIIISVIMHCRVGTPKSIEFRSKLGFNEYDITLTKEQSVLKSVMDAFEGENMQTQYSVLGYRIEEFKRIEGVGSDNYIYFKKSKGLPDERLNSNTASNYSITVELSYYGTRTRVKFSESCLKQDKVTYNHEAIVNIYILL